MGKSAWSGFKPFVFPFRDFNAREWLSLLALAIVSLSLVAIALCQPQVASEPASAVCCAQRFESSRDRDMAKVVRVLGNHSPRITVSPPISRRDRSVRVVSSVMGGSSRIDTDSRTLARAGNQSK